MAVAEDVSGTTRSCSNSENGQPASMIHPTSNGRQHRIQQRFRQVHSNNPVDLLSKGCADLKHDTKDMRYDQYSYMGKFKSQSSACRNITPERPPERATKERNTAGISYGTRIVGFQPVSYAAAPYPLEEIKCIEVVPGQYHQLRGADETWRAVQADHFSPCTCFFCPTTLFCISDALYVLCPHCNVACPMPNDDGGADIKMKRHGVGLGFTLSELADWQYHLRL
jgi:hypothetical protein